MTTPLTKIPARHEDLTGTLPAQALPDEAVQTNGNQSIAGAKNFLDTIGAPKIDHGIQGGTVENPALQVLWTQQPIEPGTARWQGTCGTAFFGNHDDQVHYHGYNCDESVPTEPRAVWGIEVHYVDPSTGRSTIEFYPEYRSAAVGGPSPRIQRRFFGATIDELTGAVDGAIELGPPQGTYGKFAYRGGPSNGGDFSILTVTTGTDAATSSVVITSPLTVQRATTLQSTLAVTGDTTIGGIVNIAKSGADGTYNEVLRAQIPGNLGSNNWRDSIEASCSSNPANSGWRFKCATSQTTQAVVLTVTGDGNVTIAGGLSVGGGGLVKRILPSAATLSFPSIAAGSSASLTITVTGAATTGHVFLTPPPGGIEAGLRIEFPRISAADTVTVTLTNTTGSPIAPASALYRVIVFNQ